MEDSLTSVSKKFESTVQILADIVNSLTVGWSSQITHKLR